MRNVPTILDICDIGDFTGLNRACTRVTVDADWFLHVTGASIGTSKKGPYRWFQRSDNGQVEVEVPNLKTVTIDRSLANDSATCDIDMYNQWMMNNDENNLLPEQLGQPGYFSYGRGLSQEGRDRWNEQPNDWSNVIVPDALLRTYQGYGAFHTDGTEMSIHDALIAGNLVLTGVWLVDKVDIGTSGIINIHCRDMGKLLIDQIAIPPLVPQSQYPVQYQRWVLTDFNAAISKRQYVPPVAKADTSAGVRPRYIASSSDWWYGTGLGGGNAEIHGHRPADSVDGNIETFALGVGNSGPGKAFAYDYLEYDCGGTHINQIYVHPYMGNYQMFISVLEGGVWVKQEGTIPYDYHELVGTQPRYVNTFANIPYIMQTGVGWEQPRWYSLPRTYKADRIRITFHNLQKTPWGPWYYRMGVREVKIKQVVAGQGASGSTANAAAGVPGLTAQDTITFCYGLARKNGSDGYWGLSDDGSIYGFGDARKQAMANSNPDKSVNANHLNFSIYATPTDQGYWILDNTGKVVAFGDAAHHGDGAHLGHNDYVGIACTKSGDGYYLIRRNGAVSAFGDAVWYGNAPDDTIPGINTGDYPYFHATDIETHPTLDGYWTLSGNGKVTAFGALPDYGSLVLRKYPGNPSRALVFGSHGDSDGEKAVCLTRTPAGDGYWILGGAFQVFEFGAAQFYGQGLSGSAQAVAPIIDPADQSPQTIFLGMSYSMVPNHAGDGYWIMRGDGFIIPFGKAEWFGSMGGTGTLRSDGNYTDFSQIVADWLLWAGFWLQKDSPPANKPAEVFGVVETTGTYLDDIISPDTWDKKKIIDCINWVKSIVGYNFYIREDGSAEFSVPNWWSVGNYLPDGTPFPYMPEIDELNGLIDFSVEWSDQQVVSHIVISTETPVDGNYMTNTTVLVPDTANLLRGIVKPAIWTNGQFASSELQRIMAELVALQIWFQQRPASATIPGNPCLSIDDQVRIHERVSGETYIHYIRGIHSMHDLDSGEYTMQLTTNWLGDAENWVITKDNINALGTVTTSTTGMTLSQSGQPQFQVSSKLLDWMQDHIHSPKLISAKIDNFDPQGSEATTIQATQPDPPGTGQAT